MALARYTYLPWLREGISTLVPISDRHDDSVPARAELPVRLQLDLEDEVVATPDVLVRLQGPGDIFGIDPAQVLRTVPAAGAGDVEGNYSAHVELSRADLPWLGTPASADQDAASPSFDKLRPWIVLLVVEDRPGVSIVGGHGSLPDVLEIADGAEAELPLLSESWAWAHVQVTGRVTGEVELAAILRDSPHLVLSRLVSPRHLADDTSYIACVVPAFEVGVKAGLGLPLTDADLERLAPAWSDGHAGGIDLPVYYSWRFSTGPDGDFESLARRLQPFPMPETVGIKEIDVGHAGSGLAEAATPEEPVVTGLMGALVSPIAEAPDWDDPPGHREQLRGELRAMLDLAAGVQEDGPDDPIVGPPFHGRWHAAESTVPAEESEPHWLRELNLDPPLRATAGLAADAVRRDQEALMQQAWEQIGDVLEANRKLRQAQLAREASLSAKQRHFDTLPSEDMRVQIASPALSRVPLSPETTAGGELRASSLPNGAVGGALRRFARPAGAVSKHSGAGSSDWVGRTLGELADPDSGVTLGNELLPPKGMGTTGHVGEANPPPGSDETLSELGTVFADYDSFLADYRGAPAPEAELELVRSQVGATLDPAIAVVARTTTRITLPEEYWTRDEPLDPVMAAPEYDRPMYEAVAPKWLVPGLEVMPEEALGILVVNPIFVEAFLTGLSHEMARELLWREYPTDQRGTYFRQFWDVRGILPPPTTEEEIEASKNIEPIHAWTGEPIGQHMTVGGNSPDGIIVVVVRGSLFRRYPNTVVYMARAAWNGPRREPLGLPSSEQHEHPVFSGQLSADVRFFGFELSVDDARGDGVPEHPDQTAGLDAGWFFVLQEQPSEPRFGMDDGDGDPIQDLTTWADLAWTSVGVADGEHLEVGAVEPAPVLDQVEWGKSSAHMAKITLQTPARVLFHADALLPE